MASQQTWGEGPEISRIPPTHMHAQPPWLSASPPDTLVTTGEPTVTHHHLPSRVLHLGSTLGGSGGMLRPCIHIYGITQSSFPTPQPSVPHRVSLPPREVILGEVRELRWNVKAVRASQCLESWKQAKELEIRKEQESEDMQEGQEAEKDFRKFILRFSIPIHRKAFTLVGEKCVCNKPQPAQSWDPTVNAQRKVRDVHPQGAFHGFFCPRLLFSHLGGHSPVKFHSTSIQVHKVTFTN